MLLMMGRMIFFKTDALHCISSKLALHDARGSYSAKGQKE